MSDPVLRVLAPARVLPDDGTPDGPAHRERLRGGALGGERFLEYLECFRSLRRQVFVRVVRIGFDPHQVTPVAAGVGESPRDVAVAADDHVGETGQRHAGDLLRRPIGIGKRQRRAIPDDRHADRQVHVVGDQRHTRRRVSAIDRPVVAADDRVLLGVGVDLLWRHPCLGLAQIEYLGTWNWRPDQSAANHRRVPLGAVGREKLKHWCGQRIAHGADGLFEQRLPSLQRVEHGEHGEDGVFGSPRFRRRAQQQVLWRHRTQCAESGIHAGRIGFEHGPIRRLGLLERAMRDIPQAVDTAFFIHHERARADQRRQLAGRLPALQIHLEETILRVHKAQRTPGVQGGSAQRQFF